MSSRTLNAKLSPQLPPESVRIDEHIRGLLDLLNENLARANRLQQEFLEQQAQALRTFSAGSYLAQALKHIKNPQQPLISKAQLLEFGTGSIAKCFGPEFAVLDQRKTPRIPNGDLLMIDRVLEISGQRSQLNPPAEITTEVDIPANVWILKENSYPGIPMAILMEMALQPCGILSAWLGTSLRLPAEVNLFRNLDGAIHFYASPDLSAGTIRNHARLLSSVSSAGMLIQKFAFELCANDNIFMAGESSFGYFRQAAMQGQAGLDRGRGTAPANPAFKGQVIDLTPTLPPAQPHLDLVGQLHFDPGGGKFGQGLIRGGKSLTGSEWFYKNHFFQDPVMPGSLGVEAILQGLWAFMQHTGMVQRFQNPHLDFSCSDPLAWKYRGQIIPSNRQIQFAIHLKENHVLETAGSLLADADFWVDGLRIYTIRNISITLTEGNLS